MSPFSASAAFLARGQFTYLSMSQDEGTHYMNCPRDFEKPQAREARFPLLCLYKALASIFIKSPNAIVIEKLVMVPTRIYSFIFL